MYLYTHQRFEYSVIQIVIATKNKKNKFQQEPNVAHSDLSLTWDTLLNAIRDN